MKKFLTLVLALLMVLAIAAPAMAFTSDDSAAEEVPYALDIYLVEYDSDAFVGLAGLPAADRGYAKNEIVAAVVELAVPKQSNLVTDGYTQLVFGGENVSLNVTDNGTPLKNNLPVGALATFVAANANKNTIEFTSLADLTTGTSAKTFKFMYFAKVTADEASLTVKLIDGTAPVAFASSNLAVTLGGTKYIIEKNFVSGTGGNYTIFCNVTADTDDIIGAGDSYKHAIRIYVDKNYKSTGMAIKYDAAAHAWAAVTDVDFTVLGVNTDNALGVMDGSILKTSGDLYNHVMGVYDDIVDGVFGMDYYLIKNYVRDGFFTDLVSAKTIIETVEIEPWTAYVAVPDNIVVDPPKTGDAASILGFVMIVLAAAAVVAVRKVRA